MLKIRRPLGRLIFNMGIAIPGKTVFLIETAPRTLSWYQDHLSYIGIYHDEDEIVIFIMWISKLVRWQLYIEMTPSLPYKQSLLLPLPPSVMPTLHDMTAQYSPTNIHANGIISTQWFVRVLGNHFLNQPVMKFVMQLCVLHAGNYIQFGNVLSTTISQ